MRVTDPATLALSRLSDSSDCITWSVNQDIPTSQHPPSGIAPTGSSRRKKKPKTNVILRTRKKRHSKILFYALQKNGFLLPLKYLRSLAHLIVKQRTSSSLNHHTAKPPSPGWPRKVFERHPEVKPRNSDPIYWQRHDHSIHGKIKEWFSVIGPELHDRTIDPVNIYNMDETGVMLSGPRSLRFFVGKNYKLACKPTRHTRSFDLQKGLDCMSVFLEMISCQ